MRSKILCLLGVLLSSASALAADPPKLGARDLDGGRTLGEPVTHANLTLFPILAKDAVKPGTAKDYLVLDEAFDKKVIAVRELASESVNELILENKADMPMFVMAGEVIIGGKQDRIIGKDMVIGPKQTLTVPVFCVEHGRWSEEKGSREFRSAKSLAHTELRLRASHDAQGEVWNEVASKAKARNVETTTQTYRTVTQGGTVDQSLAAYGKQFSAALTDARTVGFVVVMNGQITGIETFGSPQLFGKLKDKLLRSYYVEAVDKPVIAASATAKPITPDEIRAFKAKKAQAVPTVAIDQKPAKARTILLDAKGVKGSSVQADEDASPVYENLYTH
jgi:hypothetical protein